MSGVIDKIKNLGRGKTEVTIKGYDEKALELSISLPLSTAAITSAITSNYSDPTENKYTSYKRFLDMDPELNNAVTRLALLTQFAYKGILMNTDSTPSEAEKLMIKRANEAAEQFDFRAKFYSHAKHLLRDGDSVFVAALAKRIGIQQIQSLPMTQTTCVEDSKQLNDAKAIVQQRNIYVVNETASEPTKRSLFPANKQDRPVYHIALDNEGEEIYDNLGRYTFGVWSKSPIDCLKTQVLWKQSLKITDILWRYRNVPREVHKLDTSMFLPEKFQGATWEAQIAAAAAAAQTYLNNYATNISNKNVDQGYIVGSNVTEISYVQPGNKSGGQPQSMARNSLLDQLNESIREGIGAYSIGKGTYATELVTASYVILLPDWMAYKIKRALVDLLRKHMISKYAYSHDDVLKLDIRINLVLDILKGEVARQVAMISAANIKTKDELRAMLGDQPLTEEQKEELEKTETTGQGRSSPIQTEDDQLANAEQSGVNKKEPDTPHSRGLRQNT